MPFSFLSGGGELGRLIAAFDWSGTPLGPIPQWAPSRKAIVSLVLHSQVPMVTLWGTSGVMIYNDAYSVVCGARHPETLGSNVRDGWPEAAEFNENVLNVCLAGGRLSYRDQFFTLYRNGVAEPVWLNLDYSPIVDETGTPAGVVAVVVETTAKVAAERWQKSERDRQRQMFEQAPGFMAVLHGPAHVFELTNAAYRQLVGHRDVLGLPARDALPDIAGQGYFELLDQVFETGEAFVGTALRAELRRTPGGPPEERFVDLVYQPIRDPDGKVIGIFAQGADVTDRLVAEQAVRQSEAQFRAFAESMPNHVWTAAPDGSRDWFNPRVYNYSGACFEDLAGTGWAGIVHPDDRAGAARDWARAVESGGPYEAELRLRRRDGAYRWHIARAVPIRGATGAIRRWIGSDTDIDDLKTATDALRVSEARLRLSQVAAGISSLEVDIAAGTVRGSEGLWELWGLAPRESAPMALLESLVLPEDWNIRSNAATRADGSAAPHVEYRVRRPDTGEVRWLSRTIDFLCDASGRPVKMFGVMQDVTDRKEAQARQRMLAHELEHRTKNILAMVAAIASQTLRDTDIDAARATFNERLRALAKAHDLLSAARWTSASLRQVIDDTIAAFPAGRITVEGSPVELNPKMALSMALAVNELGTNAAKYGALSTRGGTVRITWAERPREKDGAAGDGAPLMEWSWTERGGPPVRPPSRTGFGSFLVGRVLGADFNGEVTIDHAPHGLRCVLTFPLPDPDPPPEESEEDDLRTLL
ncbi:PAS domain S-box protein [Amaricoccus sp.]|uniref:PAS domain S-box protein n=1 Tax=Amaricoccus sp. TaxID=1872485 RepID=UPI00262387C7|nr:PAS domain S-box protein [uncultured Amaricoccus sp.]